MMVTCTEYREACDLKTRTKIHHHLLQLLFCVQALNPGIPVASLNASPKHRNISKNKSPFFPHPGTLQQSHFSLVYIGQSGKSVSKSVISAIKYAGFSATNWIQIALLKCVI